MAYYMTRIGLFTCDVIEKLSTCLNALLRALYVFIFLLRCNIQSQNMDDIKEVCIDKLTLEAVQNVLPDDYRRLLMADAAIGYQQSSTFLVGSVRDVCDKITVKGMAKKRITLVEVLADGTDGNQFTVTIYKVYAQVLDDLLKKSERFKKRWLVFSNCAIGKYMGIGTSGWCPYSLGVGYGDRKTQVWLLNERSQFVINGSQVLPASIRTDHPTQKKYTSLKNCYPDCKYNAFAAVSEIVKEPAATRIGKLHMLMGIADPSSPMEDGDIMDTLLQIFAGNTPQIIDVLQSVRRGDIVRVRDMKMEMYNNVKRGKIFSATQLVWFSGNSDSDIEPHTICPSYVVTDAEEQMVRSLRQWAKKNIIDKPATMGEGLQTAENKQPGAVGNAASVVRSPTHGFNGKVLDPIFYNLWISEITVENQFNLWCQVILKRYVQNALERILILRVRDGTNTRLTFRKYDFEEATQDLESQADVYSPAGSDAVDVVILTKVEMAEDIEVGHYIFIKNLTCIRDNQVVGEVQLFYELSLRSDSAEIHKIRPSDSHIMIIKRAVAKQAEGREVTSNSQDSIVNLVQGVCDKALGNQRLHRSPPKRSPNRINSHPLSPPRSRGLPLIMPLSPRTLHRQEQSPEPAGSILEQSSPKLPNYTDSLDNVLKNMSDFCSQKSSSSGQAPVHMPGAALADIPEEGIGRMEFPPNLPTSTQNSYMADEGSTPTKHLSRPNSTGTQGVRRDISPISSPSSQSRSVFSNSQPQGDIGNMDFQPLSSRNVRPSNVGTNRSLEPNVRASEDIQSIVNSTSSIQPSGIVKEIQKPFVHMPHTYAGANETLSLGSLTPSPPLCKSNTEWFTVDEMQKPLFSVVKVQPQHGTKSPKPSTNNAKRKITSNEEDESTENQTPSKLPRLREAIKSPEPSTSKGQIVVMEENISEPEPSTSKGKIVVMEENKPEPSTSKGKIVVLEENKSAKNPVTSKVPKMREGTKSPEPNRTSKGTRECESIENLSTSEVPSEREGSVSPETSTLEERMVSLRAATVLLKCCINLREKKHRQGSVLREASTAKGSYQWLTRQERYLTNVIRSKAPRLTTECTGEVVYTTMRKFMSGGEVGVLYRIAAFISQIGVLSDQHCTAEECLSGICCHDWIWGLCKNCGENYGSWALRAQYSPNNFSSGSLPCVVCRENRTSIPSPAVSERNTADLSPMESPKTRKSKRIKKVTSSKAGESSENSSHDLPDVRTSEAGTSEERNGNNSDSVVPYIHLCLGLEDPENNSRNIRAHLQGDAAKLFFNVEPTFDWVTGEADNRVAGLTSLLMKQKDTLWLGVRKYLRDNGDFQYKIENTSLIAVH